MVEQSTNELFRRRKGSPDHWFRAAEDLKTVGDSVADSHLHVRLLLVGYGFENLLKALIVAGLGPDAGLAPVEAALNKHNKHQLIAMAKDAGADLNEDESAALEQ